MFGCRVLLFVFVLTSCITNQNTMVKCCAPKCDNASYNKIPEITFHRFPNNENLRNRWIKNLCKKDWQPNSSNVVCSAHFESNLLCRRGHRTILAPGAIPTLFIKEETIQDDKENVPISPNSFRKRTATQAFHSHMENQLPVVSEPKEIDQPSCSYKSIAIPTADATTSSDVFIASSHHSKNFAESASVTKLQDKIKTKNKIIKRLQERNRRIKKKVQQFTDVIAELKKKLDGEQMSILSNIPVSNKDFMVRYLRKAQSSSLEKSYPPEVRSFALQLNFFSPRAYNYVREYFNTVLPHPVTLSRWYKKIDAQPGFTAESFKTLEELSCNTEYKIFVNISIDEMAIKKEQVWDKSISKFRGHVDTGTEVSDDSLPLATQALVLMVTAVNACWKLPIAFFFISSMTGEQRANIVKIAIDMLYDINIFVIGITFDGAASNISMATILGCNFNPCNFTPYFVYNDLKIYAFYDPCHMIKLIRNCLGDFKILVDKNGNHINFEYLSLLESLAQKKGVHLGVKIRKAHIYFAKQKMKVRLATQLFSKSVADALIFCKDSLLLEEFKDCSATIDFVNIINDCFDILNSRTTLAPGNIKKTDFKN